jgi:hypothetical protein
MVPQTQANKEILGIKKYSQQGVGCIAVSEWGGVLRIHSEPILNGQKS